MLSKLTTINDEINRRLRADPFPNNVSPDYLRQAVLLYPERGGKRLRPALTLWACGLTGGDPERAWPAALAVELFHNWTLIHDDVIDQDTVRRGAPSCHVFNTQTATERFPNLTPQQSEKFGTDMAVLAGDILHSWAVNSLHRSAQTENSPDVRSQLVERMTGWLTPGLISGEAMDVEFEQRTAITTREIEEMMWLKTGLLLQFALESGAMLGLNTADMQDPSVQELGKCGSELGIAFQAQDDLLGLFGEEETFGKEVGADVRQGKLTYPIVMTMERADEQARENLNNILHSPTSVKEQVKTVRQIVEDCGARDAATDRISELLNSVTRRLESFEKNEYRQNLLQLVDYLRQRDS